MKGAQYFFKTTRIDYREIDRYNGHVTCEVNKGIDGNRCDVERLIDKIILKRAKSQNATKKNNRVQIILGILPIRDSRYR